MAELLIDPGIIEAHNRQEADGLAQDYEALSRSLARRGIDCEAPLHKVSALEIAVPSWGVGTGGTAFRALPGAGRAPPTSSDKLEDCAVIQRAWPGDATRLAAFPLGRGRRHGDGQGAWAGAWPRLRCGELQHLPGPARPGALYKFGSLSHADAEVRAQAIAHNIDCIRKGAVLGARALTIWLADGSNLCRPVPFWRAPSSCGVESGLRDRDRPAR